MVIAFQLTSLISFLMWMKHILKQRNMMSAKNIRTKPHKEKKISAVVGCPKMERFEYEDIFKTCRTMTLAYSHFIKTSWKEIFYSKKFVLFRFVGTNFKSKKKDNRSKQTLFGKGDLVKMVSEEAKKEIQSFSNTFFARLKSCRGKMMLKLAMNSRKMNSNFFFK